jgi:hypothetical protein
VKFEGSAHFNLVAFELVKIMGWLGPDTRMDIRTKVGDRFPFRMMHFMNIPGNTFEGTMSAPFYEPFFLKFVDYASPILREVDVWLWIVEDRKAEQVGKLKHVSVERRAESRN